MSLRLAVSREDNGTLVALPKAKVRVTSEVCSGSESRGGMHKDQNASHLL